MRKLWARLFGCSHESYTWPQAVRDREGIKTGDYVVCLDCGKEMPYDWNGLGKAKIA